jgi:ribosomal protein S18 acetylase RimI-like enzyme
MLSIRPATRNDSDSIWSIMQPILRTGETYTLPTDMARDEALRYWFSEEHEVFVATDNNVVFGTYYLRANQKGGGSHVANCGYMTSLEFSGQGVARAMCTHSLERARTRGFRAMQFNFVVSTNDRAVRLWQANGFGIVGQIPNSFLHPTLGYVDAYVMHREL